MLAGIEDIKHVAKLLSDSARVAYFYFIFRGWKQVYGLAIRLKKVRGKQYTWVQFKT